MDVKYKAPFNAYMQHQHLQESSVMDFQKNTSNVGGNGGSRF
jgi:hypothetical protein